MNDGSNLGLEFEQVDAKGKEKSKGPACADNNGSEVTIREQSSNGVKDIDNILNHVKMSGHLQDNRPQEQTGDIPLEPASLFLTIVLQSIPKDVDSHHIHVNKQIQQD